MVLIFARTETKVWQRIIFKKADALFFFGIRLQFYHVNGMRAKNGAGAPSVLVAFGGNNVDAIKRSGFKGSLVMLKNL